MHKNYHFRRARADITHIFEHLGIYLDGVPLKNIYEFSLSAYGSYPLMLKLDKDQKTYEYDLRKHIE
jgi:hypothetical protein